MLCVHTENAQVSQLAVAARPRGCCMEEADVAIEVPYLDGNKQVAWQPAPFCKLHAAQRAILKYEYGAEPTPFTESEIEFLARHGYNKNGIVWKV